MYGDINKFNIKHYYGNKHFDRKSYRSVSY